MAVTSAPQAMPPQHLWDPKTKSAHLKMALWKSVSPWGSFRISFPQTCKYFILNCIECKLLWSIVNSCLYLTLCDCSPSCFDPVYLLLAYLWLGLSWSGCISTIKHFHHQKQAAGTLHQQQAAGEAQQNHSAQNTIKLSIPNLDGRQCTVWAIQRFMPAPFFVLGAAPFALPVHPWLWTIPFSTILVASFTQPLSPTAAVLRLLPRLLARQKVPESSVALSILQLHRGHFLQLTPL